MDWADLTFAKWDADNYATQEDLDLYNRYAPKRDEPDFDRTEATSPNYSTMVYWQDIRNTRHIKMSWIHYYHN